MTITDVTGCRQVYIYFVYNALMFMYITRNVEMNINLD